VCFCIAVFGNIANGHKNTLSESARKFSVIFFDQKSNAHIRTTTSPVSASKIEKEERLYGFQAKSRRMTAP